MITINPPLETTGMMMVIAPPRLARQLEAAERDAWLDMYRAAPPSYAVEFQLEIRWVREVLLCLSRVIPFSLFNRALGLGLFAPADERLLDRVLAVLQRAAEHAFLINYVPSSDPPELKQWLRARDLEESASWDRIFRGSQPLPTAESEACDEFSLERVTQRSASEWADFLVEQYRVPVKPWLMALVDRTGWRHYLLRRGAQIMAVRSVHLSDNGMVWSGLEAPAPGDTTQLFDMDFLLVQGIIRRCSDRCMRYFVADIERPSITRDTSVYRNYARLGFRRAYRRGNFVPAAGTDPMKIWP